MARRPSTVSVASFASTKNHAELSHSTLTSTFTLSPSALKFPRSVPSTHSSSVQFTRVQDETTNIDPDELFAKCTIPEVRAKQVQLRSDAEAKQEELRVMVGCVLLPECPSRFDFTLKVQGTVSRSPASLNVHNFHVKVRKACTRGVPGN